MKRILFFIAVVILVFAGWYWLKPTQITPRLLCENLKIVTPQKNEKIDSPLEIKIIVDNTNRDCHWTVFEAQAGTIFLQDGNGKTLAEGVLTTQEEWMTTNPVTYTATLDFKLTDTPDAVLVINEENPSNEADAQQIILPLTQN